MGLPGNEIHLYFSFPGEISGPALLQQYRALLTDDELAQMSRLYFSRNRQQFLITRALVRTTLSIYFNVEPAEWRFGKNGYGKPEIIHPTHSWPTSCILSHCDGLVLCGVSRDHDIGVDAEDAQ